MEQIIMIVLMVAIFYFLLIRPENKRKKAADQMRSALKKGDKIVTIGGIMGTIVRVTEESIVIETSEDRVRIEFLKSAIGSVGTLDEQAAAAQRGSRKSKKAEKPAETPVEETPAETEAEGKDDQE